MNADAAAERFRRAMDAHRLGRLDEAESLYLQVLADRPRHAQALRLAGVLARERGDLDTSLRRLAQAADVAGEPAAARNELALSLLAAGRLTEAEAALRSVLAHAPGDARANANLGALLQYRGRLHAAADCHRRALAANPDDLEVRCNLASTLVDAGRGEEALAECDAALARAPRHPYLLATRGAVLLALERPAEAAAALAEATAINPADDLALTNLALARRALDDREAAEALLRRAVAGNPDNARAAAELVNVLAAGGAPEAGIAVAEAFLDRHPGERLVLAALALALADAGHAAAAKALTDLDRLVRVVDLPPPAGFAAAADFRAQLARAVLEDASLVAEPVSKSTRGGRQTGELELDADPALAALGRQLAAEVERLAADWAAAGLAAHPVMAHAGAARRLRAWGTVLAAGGRQAPHQHPLGFVSGVYYVALPPGMDAAGDGAGALEFGEPPPRWFRAREPARRCVAPAEGRLVLFPSYFHHATRPFSQEALRISIAFDAVPVGPG